VNYIGGIKSCKEHAGCYDTYKDVVRARV
jgi:hypothetical protein